MCAVSSVLPHYLVLSLRPDMPVLLHVDYGKEIKKNRGTTPPLSSWASTPDVDRVYTTQRSGSVKRAREVAGLKAYRIRNCEG